MLKAVIMAGGSGTRFWPLSRRTLPKQFLRLHGDRTLLQQAVDRIAGLVGAKNVLVITGAAHVERTIEQLPEIPRANIVGEPTGRDTAACIGLAAEICLKDDPDAQMVVLAADHLIQPTEAFHAAVSAASQYVSTRPTSLVTFGIPPVHPATGYGYLRRSDLAGTFEGVRVFKLRRFHEKPALDKAREFVASGEYFWNSGIFVWKTQTILEQLQEHVPTIRAAVGRIGQAWGTADQQSTLEAEYSEILKKSIDHAVMEHAPEVAMVETGFAWDDVGSWLALERTEKPSADGNTVIGTHLGIKSTNCVIVGDGKHVIATIGVDDLIVVHTPDATLVARRSDEQAVKELQQLLADRGLMDFA